MQNPAIIVCRYKLDPTPPCAQTMHCTHSCTLLFPLWHILEVLDRSCTDLAGLCHLESSPCWRVLHLCQAQFLFKTQLSNVSSPQDAGPELQTVSCRIFFHAVTSLQQNFSSNMSPVLPCHIKAQFTKKIWSVKANKWKFLRWYKAFPVSVLVTGLVRISLSPSLSITQTKSTAQWWAAGNIRDNPKLLNLAPVTVGSRACRQDALLPGGAVPKSRMRVTGTSSFAQGCLKTCVLPWPSLLSSKALRTFQAGWKTSSIFPNISLKITVAFIKLILPVHLSNWFGENCSVPTWW